MNLQQAERAIRNAWIAGVVSLVLTLPSLVIQVFSIFPPIQNKYLNLIFYFLLFELRIWWCPIALKELELILIILCIIMIIRKSRVFSILLFILFCIDRFTYLVIIEGFWYWLVFSPLTAFIKLIIATIFAYFFFQGIRGTLTYQQVKEKADGLQENSGGIL